MENRENDGSVQHLLSELAQLTEGNTMSLNGDIGPESFVEVVTHLDNMDKLEDFTLVLNSNGGFIEFAFRIAKAIRGKCDRLTVFVPARAKSAATLLALASDEILFGRFGELGPLDPQVPDLTGGSGLRSPLEIMKGLEFLRNYYIETFDVTVLFLLQRAGMDVAHTFETCCRHTQPNRCTTLPDGQLPGVRGGIETFRSESAVCKGNHAEVESSGWRAC